MNFIKFSRNIKNKPRNRIETLGESCKEGFCWCSGCKKCLPVKLFGKDGKRYSGIKARCKKCLARKSYKNYYMKKERLLRIKNK